MKKFISVILSLGLVISAFSGCGKNKTEVNTLGGEDIRINEMGNNVEDSSDLPDWKGKKLNLKMWYATGTGSLI